MRSAWLDIPLADYERHMADPGIGQAEMLATQLAGFLQEMSPASAAVIGCAGGNGFDQFRAGVTGRVVGIDINPQYIQELAQRYGARLAGLELYVHDIQQPVARIAPVDFVYAALVFEYVAPQPALRNIKSLCRPGGVLATVLQLPSAHAATISESPFTSVKALAAAMHLVSPTSLAAAAAEVGFTLQSSHHIRLLSGKEFAVQAFRRA